MTDTRHVVGADKLLKRIRRVREGCAGLVTDAEIGSLLERRVRKRFNDAVGPDGKPWPKLQQITVDTKRRKGYSFPSKPLQATGRLYGALRVIQGASTGLLAGATGAGFRIGINDPEASKYGRIHNYGKDGQKKRQFIGLGQADVVAVRGLLSRKMKSIAKKG